MGDGGGGRGGHMGEKVTACVYMVRLTDKEGQGVLVLRFSYL